MYREHTTPSMFDSPVKIKHTSCPQKAQEELLLLNSQDQEPRKFSFDGGSVVSCGHNFTTPSESTSDSLIVDPSDIIDDAIWNIGTAHDVTVSRRSSIMSSKSDLWRWSFENNHELLPKEQEDYPLSHNDDTIFFDHQQMPDVEQNQIMPPLDEILVHHARPNKNREATRSCLPPSRPSRRHAGLKRNQTMKTLSEQPPTAAPVATRTTLTSDVPCNPEDVLFLSRSRSLLRSMKRTIRTQDRIRKEKKKIKFNDTFVDKDVLQELMYCMQDSKKSREKVRQFLVLNQM